MDNDNHELKIAWRAQMRAALGRISPAVRAVESTDLCKRLQTQMPSAHTVLFFAPLPDEPDVWPALELSMALGTTCALPFFDPAKNTYGARVLDNLVTDIVIGKFGVREPSTICTETALNTFDLVLVPGMAFDMQGGRLGRGKGFYDRLLVEVSGIKCGVAYDFQLQERIPTEPHDAMVDFILTPNRCVRRNR